MTGHEQRYRNRKGEYTFLLFLQHTNEVVNAFDVFLPLLLKIVVVQGNQNNTWNHFLEKEMAGANRLSGK